MGYRTNGEWIVSGPAEDITAAWIKCRLLVTQPAGEDLWSTFRLFKVEDIGYIRLSFEQWKWYESYPDVAFYEAVWNNLEAYAEDDEDSISGKRVHIGEDSAIDEREFGSDVPSLYAFAQFDDDEPKEGEPLTT